MQDIGKDADSTSAENRLVMYKTKLIKFLGRSTPIVLQNDNGPCPLLAICNVLLLRNTIHLNPDSYEVSQDQLLALVADRLLESNSDVKSKDEGYVNNQQQNISDAIDLLPRLATGIDVNVHFRKINDFEFTRECAIFDLLDIGLYHGWIVDPEDKNSSAAIGSKSYNTLVSELVALEPRNVKNESIIPEEDCIDFAAAKAATFGIPHPTLSNNICFDSSEGIDLHEKLGRRGDLEEEAELRRALELSGSDGSAPITNSLLQKTTLCNLTSDLGEEAHSKDPGSQSQSECLVGKVAGQFECSDQSGLFSSHLLEHDSMTSMSDAGSTDTIKNDMQPPRNVSLYSNTSISELSELSLTFRGMMSTETSVKDHCTSLVSPADDCKEVYSYKNDMDARQEDRSVSQSCLENSAPPENSFIAEDDKLEGDLVSFSCQSVPSTHLDYAGGNGDHIDASQNMCSSLEGTEPMYEGEECILDSGNPIYVIQEPVYEGEATLAEISDQRNVDTTHIHSKGEAAEIQCSSTSHDASRDGLLIRNFLKANASQLTVYGLFCLQEGLNERELCVFFRNNHFSTMFKFNNELYLLATDQGYINQPDLVWEKLNEVNGDTVFMTGDFTEFKLEGQANDRWDQQNVMASTADYLSTLKASSPESTGINADLQLAIALQEQEFAQQHESQLQQSENSQPPSSGGRSRLIVGPQVPRVTPQTQQKQDSKLKEKCVVM